MKGDVNLDGIKEIRFLFLLSRKNKKKLELGQSKNENEPSDH